MNTDKIIAEKIAGEYAPKNTSKVVALKKLDRLAKRGAEIFVLAFGIVSSLIMGTGMCFAMGVIGGGTPIMITVGIIVGLILVEIFVRYILQKQYKYLMRIGLGNLNVDLLRRAVICLYIK